MVKSYLVVPASDLENGVPTTLANAILDADGNLTGLTNGTEYRAYLLDSTAMSPAIRPVAADTPPVDPPVEPTISLASIEALYTDPTTRGQQGTPNKTVGVDPLPSGASISGDTVNWTGSIDWGANGDKWDFNGYRLIVTDTATGTLRNARITEPSGAGWIRLVDIYPGASLTAIEWNTFVGNGEYDGSPAVIQMRFTGTGASMTTASIPMWQRNAFFNFPADAIKSMCGGVMRWNYFDTPANLPYVPPVWESGDVWNTGDFVRQPTTGETFKSLVDNNTQTPPTANTTNAFWEFIDPHSDQINPFAVIGSELEIYANYFNRSDANRVYVTAGTVQGLTNSIRMDRNNGTDYPHLRCYAHHNVIGGGAELNGSPVSLGISEGDPNWTGNEVSENWIERNASNNQVQPGWDAEPTNVVANNLEYTQFARAYVAAVIGQSENDKAWAANGSFYTQGDYPALVSGVDAKIAIQAATDKGGSDIIRTLDQSAIDATDVSPGFVAMANLWHVGSGGRPFRLADVVVPNTSADDMLDDDDTGRDYSLDASIVAAAQAEFGPISSVTYNWWNAEASVAKTLWESRSAHLLGINPDGTDYDFATGALEHCIIDTTGRGFGLFDANAKLNLMLPGIGIETAENLYSPEHINYRTRADGSEIFGMIDGNSTPAVQERKDFIADTPAANRGFATITPAVSRFGDYSGGVKLASPAETPIHPSVKDADGQQLFSQHVAMSFLVSEGYYTAPRHLRTEFASDGSYADLVFEMANGGTLSTTRKVRGGTVASPRPHQHLDGMGLVIYRAGDTDSTARPLFRLGAADAAAEYRGTVSIEDTGSANGGTREAVLRVTPEVAFSNNDAVHFGTDGGYGGFILYGHPDYDARMYLDMLIEHIPALYSGAQYPGIPVEPQVIATASGISAPSFTTASRAADTDAYLQGPNLPASTTALTVEMKGLDIPVDEGEAGYRLLFAWIAQTFQLALDPRSAQRGFQLIAKNTDGVAAFNGVVSATGVFPPVPHDLMASVALNDGGTARAKVWVDGVEVISATATGLANANMATTRRLDVLAYTQIAASMQRFRVWSGYTGTGDTSALSLLSGHDISAANFNTGAGAITKAGAATWTIS